jgi:DNA-binding NtrC family response regulator
MAVECLKLGAHDYLVKPINMETFGSALRNALEISALRTEVMSLKGLSVAKTLNHPEHFKSIITRNPRMLSLFHYIESIAASAQPVLILGETGSGKELFARAVHDASGRPGAFIAVDVAGLDDPLFSDTLFGHRQGAYTGADRNRTGLIDGAAGGTLFLDEIGDLNNASQIKLLRLLQEGVYYPLGDDRPLQCRARIITATNKPLGSLVDMQDTFRVDLYFRLSTHLIQIPPLRDRVEDIEPLVVALAGQAAAQMGQTITAISRRLLDCLAPLPFPGNVRELKTYMFDAVAQCRTGELTEHDIMERLDLVQHTVQRPSGSSRPATLEAIFGRFPTLSELTEYAVDKALEAAGNNQSEAARALGISKQALNKRLKKRKH